MKFNKEINNDILIEAVISERATFAESEIMRSILNKDIEDGWRKIIVDLKECSFMDSTFLGTLILEFKTISKLGGSLVLAGVNGDALSMLELTGTKNLFQIFESKEKALESFK